MIVTHTINILLRQGKHNLCAIRMLIYLAFAMIAKLFFINNHGNRQVWLIGERNGNCHNDNGYALFRYSSTSRPDVAAYFIVSKSIYKQHRLKCDVHNYLIYGSLKHAYLCLSANAIIYTVSHRDILYKRLFPAIPKDAVKVFLQHGVTGLKDISSYIENDNLRSADIVISVSTYEKRILTDLCGFDDSTVKVTGFPRFDYLPTSEQAPKSGLLTILYMPTLRNWLSPLAFLDGTLRLRLADLSRDPHLHHILCHYNAELRLCPHPDYIESFLKINLDHTQRIGMADYRETSLSGLIKRAHALITDYSSLAFDFIYMRKPVMFYRFDLSEYTKSCGSYIDLSGDQLGPVAYTQEQLVKNIEKYLKQRAWPLSVSTSRLLPQPFFDHVDSRNSSRAHDAIEERVSIAMRNKVRCGPGGNYG